MQSDYRKARDRAFALYAESFKRVGQEVTDEDMHAFHIMFISNPSRPVELPTAPPQGWLSFNTEFGGVPWGGRFSDRLY